MMVQIALDNARYSVSVVESAMIVWSFDFRVIGHPTQSKVYMLRDSDSIRSKDVECV